MIRLGLRLTLGGGKDAAVRLIMIATAVAIGVALLLTTLASLRGVNTQNSRYAWLETGYPGSNAPALTSDTGPGDPVWWRLRGDYYQGELIGRVDVAATGPNSPVPPGIPSLPGPGQFYASPALTTLLHDTPAAQLADRFAGTEIGTIGEAALPAPNSLIIVIGDTVADLSHQEDARPVARISTTVPSDCRGNCAPDTGIDDNGMTLVLSVVIAALLFPVLIFIGGATRLSAARREQRFAAMRLVGATPGQISVISTVESSVAAIIGVGAGFGLFYALRPTLAGIPFTGDPFFTNDLSLSLADVLFIAVGIPVAAAAAARFALRRVNISPLGVSRRVTPKSPRAWRVIPLLVGLCELGYFAYERDIGAHTGTNVNAEAAAFLSGILITMSGLVIAGPWLTMVGSRVMAGRAVRPATLIAGRRLADDPKAGFRAVSGLVLALFVGSAALAVISTVVAYNGGVASATTATKGTVIDLLAEGGNGTVKSTAVDIAAFNSLTTVPGVTGVATIHFEVPSSDGQGNLPTVDDPNSGHQVLVAPTELISCAELAKVPAFGHCRPGASAATIYPRYGGATVPSAGRTPTMAEMTWPTTAITAAQLRRLPIGTIAVATDGSTAAVEQARTILDQRFPEPFGAQTLAELDTNNAKQINGYRQLANVVILTSLPIAGCSLAVSIAGGLAERKRPFSLLRLAGTPLATLRRVITFEAAVPLLISAAVSAATGLLAAKLFLKAQLHESLQAPGAEYYGVVGAGLVASLAVIASTLPLLKRLTGPETARNE